MRPLKYRKVIKRLRKAGFMLRRKTLGSHEVWWSEVKRKTCVVPHHREINPGTLKSIVKQMGITEAEFNRL